MDGARRRHISLGCGYDRRLSEQARERGVSRSERIRQLVDAADGRSPLQDLARTELAEMRRVLDELRSRLATHTEVELLKRLGRSVDRLAAAVS